MKDLVEALVEINERVGGITDEMSLYEIDTAAQARSALELARGYAASVDMLHETIAGNIKHAVAVWVDEQAARWERKANEVERWEAAESYLTRAHAYRDIARGIREGAWQA